MSKSQKNYSLQSTSPDLLKDYGIINLTIEYWSSYGEIGLWINGQRYLYEHVDVAVIKHFLYFVRVRRSPGHALAYLKSHAKGTRVDCFA